MKYLKIKGVKKYISFNNTDRYQVLLHSDINAYSLALLSHFYLPQIDGNAFILYSFLLSEVNLVDLTFSRITEYIKLGIPKIDTALRVLEVNELLKRYIYPNTKEYIFVLYPPKSINELLLTHDLEKFVSTTQIEKTISKYTLNLSELQDLSYNFTDTIEIDANKIERDVIKHRKIKQIIENIPSDLKPIEGYKSEDISFIIDITNSHELDDYDIQRILRISVTKNNLSFDHKKFKKEATKVVSKHFLDLDLSEALNLPPNLFLRYLNKGTTVYLHEQKISKSFENTILNNNTCNAIIEYVFNHNNGQIYQTDIDKYHSLIINSNCREYKETKDFLDSLSIDSDEVEINSHKTIELSQDDLERLVAELEGNEKK